MLFEALLPFIAPCFNPNQKRGEEGKNNWSAEDESAAVIGSKACIYEK